MTTKTPFALKLFILFLSFLLVLTIVLGFLWSLLNEYEKNSPKNCINEYVELIKRGDYNSAIKLAGVETSQFFTVKDYERYIKETLGDLNKLDIFETASENSQERCYELKSESGKLIGFILKKDNLPQENNTKGYKLLQKPIKGADYIINLPDGQIPIVNGVVLNDSYIIDKKSQVASFLSLKEENLIPTTVSYKVKNLVFKPEISIKGIDKANYKIKSEIGTDNMIEIALIPNDERRKKYEKLAVDYSQTYAKYISRDVDFAQLKGYIYEKSTFFDALKTYSNVWTVEHNTPVFENLIVENTIEYSPDHFQTEVSFDYILTKGRIKRVYPTKYILSFVKVGEDFKLANLQSV